MRVCRTAAQIPDTSIREFSDITFQRNTGQLALPCLSGGRHRDYGAVREVRSEGQHLARSHQSALCHIAA